MIALNQKLAIVGGINRKQLKILDAIFAKPTPVSLEWAQIESVLIAAGCLRIEGRGSRVRFVHGMTVASFHRPHLAKEVKRYRS